MLLTSWTALVSLALITSFRFVRCDTYEPYNVTLDDSNFSEQDCGDRIGGDSSTTTTDSSSSGGDVSGDGSKSCGGENAMVAFYPTDVWVDQNCSNSNCILSPRKELAYRDTWHEATYYSNATRPGHVSFHITFEGVAIYVFFILAGWSRPDTITLTQCNFTIDGGTPVPFRHEPPANGDWRSFHYDQMVFNSTNMTNGTHQLDVVVNGEENVYINFDYAKYTYSQFALLGGSSPGAEVPEPLGPTNATLAIGLGVGLGLGMPFLTAICIASIMACCKYRARKLQQQGAPAPARIPWTPPSMNDGGNSPSSPPQHTASSPSAVVGERWTLAERHAKAVSDMSDQMREMKEEIQALKEMNRNSGVTAVTSSSNAPLSGYLRAHLSRPQ